ncbi:MAG TPA: c-type cytochrome [Nevskiaceae bacterium]|nr:c-type cytochrome [Nevskiaceae bacterium]
MDDQNHDKVFFSTFALVLGALFGIFFLCILAAAIIAPEREEDPQALARLEQRIQPFGAVVTDPALLVKTVAKVERAPYTAAEVLAKACNACHQAGVLNAPKNGDKAAWSARATAAGGLDGLTASAIKGKNGMPARGGDPSLSDDEIRAAVEQMLKDAGI